jgi:hypothetical protein
MGRLDVTPHAHRSILSPPTPAAPVEKRSGTIAGGCPPYPRHVMLASRTAFA